MDALRKSVRLLSCLESWNVCPRMLTRRLSRDLTAGRMFTGPFSGSASRRINPLLAVMVAVFAPCLTMRAFQSVGILVNSVRGKSYRTYEPCKSALKVLAGSPSALNKFAQASGHVHAYSTVTGLGTCGLDSTTVVPSISASAQ